MRGTEWSPTRPNDVLAVNASMLGAPILDLLPTLLRAAERSALLYFPNDEHWTSAGHAAAALAVEAFLREQALLP